MYRLVGVSYSLSLIQITRKSDFFRQLTLAYVRSYMHCQGYRSVSVCPLFFLETHSSYVLSSRRRDTWYTKIVVEKVQKAPKLEV